MSFGGITIVSPGLDKLAKNFPVKIKKTVKNALGESALVVQNAAKVKAPYITGNLRRSITHELGAASAKVGTDVIYARVREFNTRRLPGGYLRPALTSNKNKIKAIFEKHIKKLLKYK